MKKTTISTLIFLSTIIFQLHSQGIVEILPPVQGIEVIGDKHYLITSYDGLKWIRDTNNSNTNPFAKYLLELGSDIEIPDSNWIPIGIANNKAFVGNFNGNGHTITLNIDTINNTSSNTIIGLFGYISNSSSIKNLIVDGQINLETSSSAVNCGAISGVIQHGATIVNCHNKANIIINALNESGNIFAGGIAGLSFANADGLAKFSKSTFLYNKNTGSLNIILKKQGSSGALGGIVGRADYTNFSFCESNGDLNFYSEVSNSRIDACGIIGRSTGGNQLSCNISYNTSISGNSSADVNKINLSPITLAGVQNDTLLYNYAFEVNLYKKGILTEPEFNIGHDKANGEIFLGNIIDLSNPVLQEDISISNKEIDLNGIKNYILLRSADNNINANHTGNLICLGADVNTLCIGKNVNQKGYINSKKLTLYDNCTISELGIKNEGDIIYYRTPSIWANKYYGWESICLPFDADLYVNDTPKRPFVNENDKSAHYWLVTFDSSDETTIYLSHAVKEITDGYYLKANFPMAVSLPGKEWGSHSMESDDKIISYRGYGEIKPLISNPILDYSQRFSFVGTHMGEKKIPAAELKVRYVLNGIGETPDKHLNENGSFFGSTKVALHPFRAYFVKNDVSAIENEMFKVSFPQEVPTSIVDYLDSNGQFTIFTKDGFVFIKSSCSKMINIINATTGIIVKQLNVEEGENRVVLPKGIYIIDGQKLVV